MSKINRLEYQQIGSDSVDKDTLEFIRDGLETMWSGGGSIAEMMRCVKCDKVLSLQEAYPYNPPIPGDATLSEALKLGDAYSYLNELPKHEDCGNLLQRIYDVASYTDVLRHIFATNRNVSAIIARDHEKDGGFAGIAIGYMASLETAYEVDLVAYYSRIGIHRIRGRIAEIIGSVPQHIFHVYAIGFLPRYRSHVNVHDLFYAFTTSFPESDVDPLGICVIDKKNLIWNLVHSIDGFSLFHPDDVEYESIGPKHPTCSRDIVLIPQVFQAFRMVTNDMKRVLQLRDKS